MALIDTEELFDGSIDNEPPKEEEPPKETPPAEEPPKAAVPDKYQGKSIEDIVKMHQEAEKLIGRQAQEVHEVRSLADQLLKQQLDSTKANTKPIEESHDEDFFADPKQSINKAVEQHPAVVEAKQVALDMKKMKTAQQLAAKHPDFTTIAQDSGFQDWVKSSPVRLQLYARADAEFDFESADELLSTYKEIKQFKTQQSQKQSDTAQASAQDKALKAAAVDVGGTGEFSQKTYRRADLIKLRMTDPDRYMSMEGEILQAYADGRVK